MWTYNNELYHHGILGMRWGIRRYQNKDGKKRYDSEVENARNNVEKAKARYNKSKASYNKATLGGMVYNEKATKELEKSSKNLTYSKEDLSNAKIKSKMNAQTKVSARQLNLRKKYQEQGMTEEEAKLAAYKRVKTEKIIAVTAGIALTAAAAYVAYKHYDTNVDSFLKDGSVLQNISRDSNKGVSDAFYASINKMDNNKYRGLYGKQLNMSGGNKIYETKIGINGGLRIASQKSATNALSDLVGNNKNYSNTLVKEFEKMEGLYSTSKQNNLISKGLNSLKSGKVDKNVYEALNLMLVDHSPMGQELSSKLYETLKSKGYDAIKDINDKKYSGYKSSNPLIVFNGASKATVNSIRELGENEIAKSAKVALADIVGRDIAEKGAIYATLFLGGSAGTSAIKTHKNDKFVSNYRKEHPDSELSYDEIIRNIKNA